LIVAFPGWKGGLAAYFLPAQEAMMDDLERLTRDGTVPQDAYRVMRDAIQRAGEQSGRLYDVGHEAHYQALAAVMALKAAGYGIAKVQGDA
jgi:hypothetical protein